MTKDKNIEKNEEMSLNELAREITARGNDMEVRHSRDGMKVFEVVKKLIKIIPSEA